MSKKNGAGECLFWLAAAVIFPGAGVAEPANPKWEGEISAIENRELANPSAAGSILFTGSSSIRLWDSLAKDFPDRTVINQGFGGSQISDLIAYFDRVVLPAAPRQIVIYSGTNDLNAGEPFEQVFADMARLCGMIQVALPETKIAWIAAAPNPARWAQRDVQRRFNALVTAYCEREGHDFIDVWTPMLGDDGQPSRDIYRDDKLHMNAAGYAIWRKVIKPYLIETKERVRRPAA